MVRRHYIGLAALKRLDQAQQPDQVAVVRVEELARARAVDAHAVDRGRVLAQVLDVAQHMAAPVLRHKVAQIRAQPHVGDRALVHAPFRRRHALEERKALARQDVLTQRIKQGRQRRQREASLQ